jgi:hypothetical protein
MSVGWDRHPWLMPVIPATQKAEIRRITVRSQPRQIVLETLSWKTLSQKTGLVEWLKVEALSSKPQYHTHTQKSVGWMNEAEKKWSESWSHRSVLLFMSTWIFGFTSPTKGKMSTDRGHRPWSFHSPGLLEEVGGDGGGWKHLLSKQLSAIIPLETTHCNLTSPEHGYWDINREWHIWRAGARYCSRTG